MCSSCGSLAPLDYVAGTQYRCRDCGQLWQATAEVGTLTEIWRACEANAKFMKLLDERVPLRRDGER